MFRAVRERLGTAWSRAREKRLIGLFAFEFGVVVLGVLAAQGVQSWAQERDRRHQAEVQRVRLEQEFIDAVQVAKVWRAALPCLRQRVGDVMRVASSGGTLSDDMARRPKVPALSFEGSSAETYSRIAKSVGREQSAALENVQDRVSAVDGAVREIRSQWELFRLLDVAFGQPGGTDHAAARAAGAKIFTELRNIEVALDGIEGRSAIIRARQATPFDREFGILPVRNCAELWAKGTAYRAIDPGEVSPY